MNNPEPTIAGLPKYCGVVLRDYNNPKRSMLIKNIKSKTQRNKQVLFVAKPENNNKETDWQHWPNTGRGRQRKHNKHQLVTTSAHNLYEIGRANRLNINAILLSPLFTTKSHPKANPLNIHRFARLARLAKKPVYALGGVNKKTIKTLASTQLNIGVAGIGFFK